MTEQDERAMAEELEQLAEAEARGDADSPTLHPARNPRSQVYSIRLPLKAASELQKKADAAGVTPGSLLRQWVLAALGDEPSGLLTHDQAEAAFRETLSLAVTDAISTINEAVRTPRSGVNLGPRMVQSTGRNRRSA